MAKKFARKKGAFKKTVSKGKALIALVLVCLIVGAVIASDYVFKLGILEAAGNAANAVIAPVGTFFTDTVSKIKNDWRVLVDKSSILEENKQLLDRIAELERENDKLLEYEKENERLRNLFDLDDTFLERIVGYARVTNIASTGTYGVFSIDKGIKHGLAEGMAIVSAEGYVGTVYECHRTWSKVRCIIDPQSAVSVLDTRSRVIGIAGGNSTLYYSDDLIYIKYLPLDADISVGDTIITSGYDALTPKGIYVGTVKSISVNRSSNYLTAIVEGNVSFLSLEEVVIVSMDGL